MNKLIIGTMVVAFSWGAVACSDDSSGGVGAKQQAVIDLSIKKAKEFGLTADKACVTKLAAKLSNADAQLVLDNPDGNPTLSAAGEKLGVQLKACFSASGDTVPGASSDTVAGATSDTVAGATSDTVAGASGGLDSSMKATIVDTIMTTLGASLKLDRACVEEAINSLSDADLQSASSGGSNSAFTAAATKIATECLAGN